MWNCLPQTRQRMFEALDCTSCTNLESALSLPWTQNLLRDVSTEGGVLCERAGVIGNLISETPVPASLVPAVQNLVPLKYTGAVTNVCRSEWPRGLRRGSMAAPVLGLGVRNSLQGILLLQPSGEVVDMIMVEFLEGTFHLTSQTATNWQNCS